MPEDEIMKKKIIPKKNGALSKVVERNINTMLTMQRQLDAHKSFSDRVADRITAFCSSVYFVFFHVAWFGLWVAVNLGIFSVIGVHAFDPFPFGLLTMIVSLEAIFLSTFVLISQNRLSDIADRRSDLDVQVDLVAEYEITKVLRLVDAIADHLGVKEGLDPELEELEEIIPPDVVMKAVDKRKRELGMNGK
jgi:uncharacterized membrane protein